MATALFVVGIAFVVVGLITFLIPAKPDAAEGETAQAEGIGKEIAEVLEALNKMMDKLDKRFRPGMFLILLGWP